MPNDRMNINRLQRQHMLDTMNSGDRTAAALERLCVLFEAYLAYLGAPYPPEMSAPQAPESARAPQSFNPFTESAPGVPLSGQEKE